MKQNTPPNIFRMVEHKHAIHLTNELIKCINKYAETEDNVLGFGQTLHEGYRYNTVYIRCGDTTRQVFFDPETSEIRDVEPGAGITAATAIYKIRNITSSRLGDDEKLYLIEEVLDEVEAWKDDEKDDALAVWAHLAAGGSPDDVRRR